MPLFLALQPFVHAQDKSKDANVPNDELQEVVVTGSHIARPDIERLQPTAVLSGETFDQRGYTDIGQALSSLPQFGVQPSSAIGVQGSGFGIAQSFVDLDSLGSQRTLVLVNGMRFVSSNTPSLNGVSSNNNGPGSQVDLNNIPTKLIDRIETIGVGGAPIYGTDAIAGTVNIILKKDYEGTDIDAQAGVSDRKDAWNERIRALWGHNFADGRANITVDAEIYKNDGLLGTARSDYANDDGFLAPATPGPYQTVLYPANSVPAVSYSGIPLVDDTGFVGVTPASAAKIGVTNPAGQLLAFAPGTSQLQPYNLGTLTGNPVFNSGGDGLRLSQVSQLLSPTEKINLDTLGHFKLNDSVNLFSETWFAETHATDLTTQPAYNTDLFGGGGTALGNFVVGVNNPFLTPSDRTLIQTALQNYLAAVGPTGVQYAGAQNSTGINYPAWNLNQFYVSRANTDLQSGRATASQVLARQVLGANGDFSIGDRNFNWQVAGNYGYSRNDQVTPSIVFQNEQNALNATTNAAGQIVCAGNPVNAPISTVSSTCAPLNIFGSGVSSLAARQYITHLAFAESYDTQRDATANLTGDVVHLPGGDLKASIGYENRREAQYFDPDAFYTENLGQTPATAVEGAYTTNEFYAETLIPIFGINQDIPALRQLDFEGAARRVANSIAGTATTWTEGLTWSPTEDLMFRANRTKSIRAPSVTELFLPSAVSFQFANDPCDKNFVNQGTAPATRAKNCAAAGIDTATFTSDVVNATAQGTSSGNQNLVAETADSRTIGVVLHPRWVPHFTVNLDYIDIRITNAIASLTLVQLLDACYDSSNYPNNPSCAAFSRNSAGQITSFHAGYVNAGLLEFQGWQGGADWNIALPGAWGSLDLNYNIATVGKLTSIVGSASPIYEAGEIGTSKNKSTTSETWTKGPFSWSTQEVYVGPANFNNQNTATSSNYLSVHSWWQVNTSFSYDFYKNFTARFIVDNVFDREPPFPALAGSQGNFAAATTQYFSGIIGRTYLLNVEAKF
jgi:outer membrane receptor protein involved in Fe transport